MRLQRILTTLTVKFALAAVFVVAVMLVFSGHWRVMAVEQVLLSPWLRPAYLGDGKPASELLLCYPMGVALDVRGELLISDRGRDRKGRVVWRIDSVGIAHVVAGSGRRGEATAEQSLELDFEKPEGLAVDRDGRIYVSDGFNHSIFRIDPDRSVSRIAGTGRPGFAGDGGKASEAMFFRPADIRLDSKGNLFVADVRNHRVRKIEPSGGITTVAGTGQQGFSPDGTLAAQAHLNTPWGIAIDRQDRLLIADGANHRVRRVEHDGRLVTIAGSGREGYSGDGGPAIEANLNFPEAMFVDADGKLYIGDELNHAVRVVGTEGMISTVIGTGSPGRAVIGALARGSALDDPEGVLIRPNGDLIVTDGNNGRVLRISGDGVVHSFAGRGDTEPCASRF